MSGSYYGQYALATNQLELARKQAELVGCTDVESSANIMKCLKTKMTEEIVNSQGGFKVSQNCLAKEYLAEMGFSGIWGTSFVVLGSDC